MSARVAQTHPYKVKKFMQQDALVFVRRLFQRCVENDESLADEGRGVRGIARSIAQSRAITNRDRAALKELEDVCGDQRQRRFASISCSEATRTSA